MRTATPDTRTFILLCVAGSVGMCSGAYILVASPYFRDILNLQPEALGLLLSAPLISGVAGTLLGGWLADSPRPRASIFGGFAVVVTGYLLCAVPPVYNVYMETLGGMTVVMTRPSLPLLFTGNFLVGMGFALIATIINVVITRLYPEGSRRYLTWYQVAISAVGMVALPAWDALHRVTMNSAIGLGGTGMQTLFFAAALLCGTSVLPLLREKLPVATRTEGDSERKPGITVFLSVPFLIVCVFVSLHVGADNGIALWIPDFVTRTFDPPEFPPAWILSAYSGAYFVGRLILANLPERWNDLTIICISAGFGGLLNIIAFQSGNQYVLTAMYTMAALVMSADYPSILAYTGRQFPESTGRIMAVSGAVGSAVSFGMPPFIGYIGKVTGSMVTGMMLPAGMLLTLSLLAFVWRIRTGRTR